MAPTLRGDGLGSLIELHFLNKTKTCQVYGGSAKQLQETTPNWMQNFLFWKIF